MYDNIYYIFTNIDDLCERVVYMNSYGLRGYSTQTHFVLLLSKYYLQFISRYVYP